jgi:hypothetical protein
MDDTDEALALAAIPSQDPRGTDLWAACNAALDAQDAALVVLARWCDEHSGDVSPKLAAPVPRHAAFLTTDVGARW